jgi:hypothetical protein
MLWQRIFKYSIVHEYRQNKHCITDSKNLRRPHGLFFRVSPRVATLGLEVGLKVKSQYRNRLTAGDFNYIRNPNATIKSLLGIR